MRTSFTLNHASSLKRPPTLRPVNLRSFLQQPSHLRILSPHIARFHASPRHGANESAAAESGLNYFEAGIHVCLESLHSMTGLSWAFAIPLSAVLIRAALLPSAIYNRKATQRRADLAPLLSGWNTKNMHRIRILHGHDRDRDWMRRTHMKMNAAVKNELVRRWSCGWFSRNSTFLFQLPIFLSVAEVYRRMCGLQQGVVSSMFTNMASYVGISRAGQSADAPAPLADTSLAVEGMLWFPDLMIADETWMLSGCISFLNLLLVIRSHYRSTAALAPGKKPSSTFRGFTLMNAGFTLFLIPLTQGLPAGVLLYWASSTAATFVTHLLMDSFYPFRRSPTACERKARISYGIGKG